MLNIDIDTGGTMTDGLVSAEGETFSVKVETTPHDLTVAFINILGATRDRLGYASLEGLLDQVALIRWSSTITSNVLAQRAGPKLGLLVSAGHEDDLYARDGQAQAVIGTLIDRANIAGIDENASEDEVRTVVKSLFDKGIRRINISLAGAFEDNSREEKIVAMIDAQYPDHFLGSIPALPANEICLRPDDMTRTFVSLINAYVHPSLAIALYRAEELVRQEHGWRGNVLAGHINGGVARIGKTTAFDTIESGPLFGTHAVADYARGDDIDKVIAVDVGGTTAKASAVDAGRVAEREEGSLFGIPLQTTLPLLRSVALGGGSVARVAGGKVNLGPDSMGAAPGPACYGLGGRNATLTDAFVVLGQVDPTGFLDGRRTLDVAKAREAIDRAVGAELGISSEEGAQRIADAGYEMVAQLARDTATEQGWDPAETAIYAFGGNGPLFATGVADRLGARTARVFGLGHVLSAYGSAISDVVHVYESAVNSPEAARAAAERLAGEARRDLAGEGFDPDQARLSWQVRDSDGARHTAEGDDISGALQSRRPTLVRLSASYPLPSVEPPSRRATGAPTPAGQRGEVATYEWASLPGSRVDGPALIDGGSFTWLVGAGWSASTDNHGDAVLSKGGNR
jgi:acetophenone carboxylase